MAVPQLFPGPPLEWIYPAVVGQDWPQGDEDLARQAAQAWTDALNGLVQLADTGSLATDTVNYSVQGVSSEVFNGYWDKYVAGDNSYLGQQAQQCQQFAAYLLEFAEQLEHTKLSINIQLAMLLVQVAYDLLLAPFTDGLSLAEAMLATVMTRGVVRLIVGRLLESVLYMVIPDLLSQTIQLANGHASTLDGKRLLTDLEMGVVAGVTGLGLYGLAQRGPVAGLLRDAADHFGENPTALVSAMAQGAVVNVTTNAAMYYLPTPDGEHPASPFDNWLRAALSGAVVGGVFHGLNQLQLSDHTVATFRDPTGRELYHGIQYPDGSYSLITPDGVLAGRGALSPDGTLTIGGRSIEVGQASFSTADGAAHIAFSPGTEPRQWGRDISGLADLSLQGPDGQRIEVPAGSTFTIGPDGRIVQVAVHDGARSTFYQPAADSAGTPEAGPPVLQPTGAIERTATGGMRYFDAAGNAISRADFRGTVFSQHLEFGSASGQPPPDAHAAAAGQIAAPAEPGPLAHDQSVDRSGSTEAAATAERTAAPNKPAAVDIRQQVDTPREATRATVGSTQISGPERTPVAQAVDATADGAHAPTVEVGPADSTPVVEGRALVAHAEATGSGPTVGEHPITSESAFSGPSDPSHVEQAGRHTEQQAIARWDLAQHAADRAGMLTSGDPAALYAAVVRQIFDATGGKLVRWPQFAAADAMSDGKLVQMAPGEGKSFVATLAVARYAITKGAVWLMTTHQTLADRDFEFNRTVLDPLGIRVVRANADQILAEPPPGEPTVFVGSVDDFAFSELNGHPVPGVVGVVDEIDGIGVDQAHQAFILSDGTSERASAAVVADVRWAKELFTARTADGTLTEASFGREPGQWGGDATLTEPARRQLEAHLDAALTEAQAHRLEMAALARWGFRPRDDYVINGDKLIILNQVNHEPAYNQETNQESRWNGGLAQALEAEHSLPIRADPTTSRSITTKELLGRLDTVVGMSGTAKPAEAALRGYGLGEVVEVPRLHDSELDVYLERPQDDETAKIAAIVRDVVQRQEETNQPQLLIVDRNSLVDTFERQLAAAGAKNVAGIDAERVLAWGDARDGEIENLLDRAGALGSITVGNRSLTRGVNVPLQSGAREAGGLSVAQTAFSDISARVDLQTINRAARYGDPGEAHQYSAKTDAILHRLPSKNVTEAVVRYQTAHDVLGPSRDSSPGPDELRQAAASVRSLIEDAQARAERDIVASLGQTPRGADPRVPAHSLTSQPTTPPQEHPPPVPPGASLPRGLNRADAPTDVRLRHLQEGADRLSALSERIVGLATGGAHGTALVTQAGAVQHTARQLAAMADVIHGSLATLLSDPHTVVNGAELSRLDELIRAAHQRTEQIAGRFGHLADGIGHLDPAELAAQVVDIHELHNDLSRLLADIAQAPREGLAESVSPAEAAALLLPEIRGHGRHLLGWGLPAAGDGTVVFVERLGPDLGQRATELVSVSQWLPPISGVMRVVIHGRPGEVVWDHYAPPQSGGTSRTIVDQALDGVGLVKLLVHYRAFRDAVAAGATIQLDVCGVTVSPSGTPVAQQVADTLNAWRRAVAPAAGWADATIEVRALHSDQAPDALLQVERHGRTTLVREERGPDGQRVLTPVPEELQGYRTFHPAPRATLPDAWLASPIPGGPPTGEVTQLLPELVIGQRGDVRGIPAAVLSADLGGPSAQSLPDAARAALLAATDEARAAASRSAALAAQPEIAALAQGIAAVAQHAAVRSGILADALTVNSPTHEASQALNRATRLQRALATLNPALDLITEDLTRGAGADVLADHVATARRAGHQLAIEAGSYDDAQARAETAAAAALDHARGWVAHTLARTGLRRPLGLAVRLAAVHAAVTEVHERRQQLAAAVQHGSTDGVALVPQLARAVDRLAQADAALPARRPPAGQTTVLSAELTGLVREAGEAVSFSQRERAWRRSRTVHSKADVEEIDAIAREPVKDARLAGLLAAEIDALYQRVRAADDALAERAERDQIADHADLVSAAEQDLLALVLPADWLPELVTVVGRYRDRRDHGMLNLGHLGGVDPVSTTLLAGRENVRALRRQINAVWQELNALQTSASSRSSDRAMHRYRLRLLLRSHNEQLPVLIRDIEAELAMVSERERDAAAAGDLTALDDQIERRRELIAELGQARAQVAAQRRRRRALRRAHRQGDTPARMLLAEHPDLGAIRTRIIQADPAEMDPAPILASLERQLDLLVEPVPRATANQPGITPELMVDVTDPAGLSVAALSRAYTGLLREHEDQQAVLDDPARLADLHTRLAPARQLADAVDLMAEFESAYRRAVETARTSLTTARELIADLDRRRFTPELEALRRKNRLTEATAAAADSLAHARLLAWLWTRGAQRLWAPEHDRRTSADLVARVNHNLRDLPAHVRADVVAAIEVRRYLDGLGLLRTVFDGREQVHDGQRATDRQRGSDLALDELHTQIQHRIEQLAAEPDAGWPDPEIQRITAELDDAMKHRQRAERYLRRADRVAASSSRLQARDELLRERRTDAAAQLRRAQNALDRPSRPAAAAWEVVGRRDELAAVELQLAEASRARLRQLDTELRELRAGGLPADISEADVDRVLADAQQWLRQLAGPLRDVDVAGARLRDVLATVDRLQELSDRISPTGPRAIARVAAAARARAAAPRLDAIAESLDRLTSSDVPIGRWGTDYLGALTVHTREAKTAVTETMERWNSAQQQRRVFIVQLAELSRDIGLILADLHQTPAVSTARQRHLLRRIAHRQTWLARWRLQGPTRQPMAPDPAANGPITPAPARHLVGSDPVTGASILSTDLGVNPEDWVGVHIEDLGGYDRVSYDVERWSPRHPFGGLLPVRSTLRQAPRVIHLPGADLRIDKTIYRTTILESRVMMTRISGALPPRLLSNRFGLPFDLPGVYPNNEGSPPGAPPHFGPVPTAVAIQFPRLPFGLLLQGIVRAPFISGEAFVLPTAFHDFDHVEGATLTVTKIPKYEIGPDGRRRKMADPLPDLPSKYEIYVPAVDVARTGGPSRRLDWQLKGGVGADLLLLAQPYYGHATDGLGSLLTLGAVGGVLQAQLTNEPKLSWRHADVGLGVEWVGALFFSLGFKPFFPSGAWQALGGLGLSATIGNRVHGRSLMPFVENRGTQLARAAAARYQRLATPLGVVAWRVWSSGLLTPIRWSWEQLRDWARVSARSGAPQPLPDQATDTAVTRQLAAWRRDAQAEQAAVEPFDDPQTSPAQAMRENAHRLAVLINHTGLPGTSGVVGDAATHALAAVTSAEDLLRADPAAPASQLAVGLDQLRRGIADLASQAGMADRAGLAAAVAAVDRAAQQLRASVHRNSALRSLEELVTNVLELDQIASRPDPSVRRPSEFSGVAGEIESWVLLAGELALTARDLTEQTTGEVAAQFESLGRRATEVSQHLGDLRRVVTAADAMTRRGGTVHWAGNLSELWALVLDIEPLRRLEQAIDALRATAAGAVAPTPQPPTGPPSATPVGAPRTTAPQPGLRTIATRAHFRIGMSVTAAALTVPAVAAHVAREAAEVTTEGMLGWSTMHPRRDEYDFRSFDALIQFAATHNQTVHGHALVSPDDLPSWLDADTRRRELRDILTAHITTLVHRYRGQIAAWTVVDRPLSDTGGRRRSLWQVRLGPSYVRNAFRAAASADPDAKLYLADYDIVGENPNKTTRFYRLVRELRDSGVPVHGVEVQLRPAVRIGPDGVPFASWSPDTVRRHLGRLRDLGLDIAITVEVRLPEHAGSDVLEVQARTYAEATRIAQQVTAVRSMTIWGASDGLSSVSEHFPGTTAATPFTSDLAPKPAYHALRQVLLDSAPVPGPPPGGAPSAVRQALATTPAVAPQSTAAERVTIEELTLGGRDLSAAPATPGRIAAPPIATARPIELFGLPDLQQIDIETGTDTAEFYQLVVALREASIARNRTLALVERADGRRYVVTLGRHGGYLNPAAPDSPAWQYLLEAYRELGESIGSPPPFIRVLVHSEAHRPERTQPALADQELLLQAPGQASAVLVRREGAPIRYRVAAKEAPLDPGDLRVGSRLRRRVRFRPPTSGPGTGQS